MPTPAAFAQYWEQRARRYASDGHGLRAVCSYGMPGFYNRAIHLTQRLALSPWLRVGPDTAVLDVGCGIGRWSRRLASRGARVTGIDLSPTMVAEARARATQEGVGERCRFLVADLAELELRTRYDLVLCVTVLQHILDPERHRRALERLQAHLSDGGRLVLLEAIPSLPIRRCDSRAFRAIPVETYERLFGEVGLRVEQMTGVDTAPLKSVILPAYGRLPRPVGYLGLAAATALSLPVDLAIGRRLVNCSWHKVVVLRREPAGD
jgi:2-polyprenyl-3-methyl-5-hydroxy-6-metoxy-1,4-benzoquinol methylase